MIDPIPWIFFCREHDYLKFRTLIPKYPLFHASTYAKFVAATEGQIERDRSQVIRTPVTVSYDKFMGFRDRPDKGAKTDKELLDRYTFLVWGGKK